MIEILANNYLIYFLNIHKEYGREQQLKHEREYYDKLKPFLVNAKKPMLTRSERIHYNHVYNHEYNKVPYLCPVCCVQITRGHRSRHNNGIRHLKLCQLSSKVDTLIKQFKPYQNSYVQHLT